jgi:PPK2 family polyphosphate:nucleotide phosphotransferase
VAKKSSAKLDDFRVRTGKFKLAKFDPDSKPFSSGDKVRDRKEIEARAASIDTLQDLLWSEQKRRFLLVLQGMDTSGKDGTVRAVFSHVSPLGMKVVSYKAPSSIEKARDYLWRVHANVPASGEIAIFNRSHYEDVLITQVHGWIDAKEAKRRIAQINEFERMLVETGTTVLKCFLHISNEEQKARLEARLADPTKHWKFDPSDLKERAHWPDYMRVYEGVLAASSTSHAPWYVIPANSKTQRNLMIGRLVEDALKGMKLKYPAPNPEFFKLKVE